ncbi:hypothetical protein NL676_039160 [Syzygium grande]|nr:hypothetical protein NL676_039160 [Syzygium grande]
MWFETLPPHDSVVPGSASSCSNSRSHQLRRSLNSRSNRVCALSRNRRVTVRSWHGQVVVNVREFYVKDSKSLPGKKGIGQNAIWAVMTVVVVLEFTAGGAATYVRFIPTIRKNYDYGVMIFILTFSLILVSNYWVDNTPKMA